MATPKNIARTAYALIATSSFATVQDVARTVRISKATAQAALDQLEAQGLIGRGLPSDTYAAVIAVHQIAANTIEEAKARYDVATGTYPQRAARKAQPRAEAANSAPSVSKTAEATKHVDTREAWLRRAVPTLARMLAEKAVDAQGAALVVPAELQVSVGFVRNSKTAIGVCIDAMGSVDGITRNVLVCPTLADGVRVLDVLLHELVHAALGTKHKHDKVFAAAARAVGLEGKPTATVAGEALKAELTGLVATLGEYPHVAVKARDGIRKPPPGKSEWVRVYSKTMEGYLANVRRDQVEEYGLPMDPEGDEMTFDKPW